MLDFMFYYQFICTYLVLLRFIAYRLYQSYVLDTLCDYYIQLVKTFEKREHDCTVEEIDSFSLLIRMFFDMILYQNKQRFHLHRR